MDLLVWETARADMALFLQENDSPEAGLVSAIYDQPNPTGVGYETRWGKSGIGHVYEHSLRVERLAVRLTGMVPDIHEGDARVARMAAVYHDIGYVRGKEGHAERGAEFFTQWAVGKPFLRGFDCERIAEIIRKHSGKGEPDGDIASMLLKDADCLDAMGAMSVLLVAKQYRYEDAKFYQNIVEHLETKEITWCRKEQARLYFRESREYMEGKIGVIAGFAAKLREEMGD